MSRRKPLLDEYTVGWICALPIELAAAQEILDEQYQDLSYQDANDSNLYTLGRIGKHKIVIACLAAGQIGTNSAATTAARMKATFTSIRFGLMVGIGGGVPSDQTDIRLGDVIISQPTKQNGGVIQYDMGKTMPRTCERTGSLNSPPEILLNALSKFKANRIRDMSNLASQFSKLSLSPVFTSNSAGPDILFESTYEHLSGDGCERCDIDRQVKRSSRGNEDISIHYGTIASGKQLMRDAQSRDQVSQELGGVLCFDMEAAGLMNNFPCLVLRGICDYADSHKSKTWQPYASVAAAVCAKEILSTIPNDDVGKARRAHGEILSETLRSAVERVQIDPFLHMVSDKEQEEHKPRSSIDFNQQRFQWVSKNLDFKHWKQSKSSQLLWLTGPSECSLHQVSSHVIQPSNVFLTTPCVLYFFCSPMKEKATSARAVYNFLHQVICWSSTKKIDIIKTFLHALRERLVKRREKDAERREKTMGKNEKIPEWYHKFDTTFNEDSPTSTTIEQMLDAASSTEQWAALQGAMNIESKPEMLIVIDGLDDVEDHRNDFIKEVCEFAEYLLKRKPTTKVLLTSRPRVDLKESFSGFPCIEYDKERKECLASLRFDNSRYGKISAEHEGSLEWIWTHEQCKNWLGADASRLLYLQGKPGSGKSTVTKYFAKLMLERDPNIKSAVLATFFYSWREGEAQRSHVNMLRSILHGILDQHEAFFYHLFQSEYRLKLKEHGGGGGSGGVKWDYSSLKTLFLSLQDYAEQERFYVIIDAVDESDDKDQREMLDLFLRVCSGTQNCVLKVFIASRPFAALEKQTRNRKFHNFIRLQDETQADISRFANAFLQRVEFPNFIEQARKYVVDNANGVFLWVRLVGEELLAYDEQGCAEEDIFEFLKSLPTELDELYRLMLGKMIGRTPKVTKAGIKMFRFVLFACRPLSVCELLHALGIPDDPKTEFLTSEEVFYSRIPQERHITHCGGNFLEIKQQDGVATSISTERATVQAMHQTVREFFLRPNGMVAMTEFKMDGNEAHVCIAITCIRYLMLCIANMATGPSSDVKTWSLEQLVSCVYYLNQRPLASYSLMYLSHHLDRCQGDPYVSGFTSQFIDELTCISGGALYLFENWVRSHMGKALLRKEADVTAKVFRERLLNTAVKNGFSEATKVLVLAGANLHSKGGNGRTLLVLAAEAGHEAVVRVLLDHKADPGTTDKDGRSALSWAARNGHETVVRLLLERTVYPGPEKDGGTPLGWASRYGHEGVVRLLLERGADSKMVDNDKRTPLGCAARNGHVTIVRLLLQNTAGINGIASKNGGTALIWAARNGHETVVRLLLQFNADVNMKDTAGLTALYWAARNRHRTVVQFLLERQNESGIDAKDKEGSTALSWAVRNGDETTVRLLLQRKAGIDTKDKSGSTALLLAVRKGDKATVQLLLEQKADVDTRDEDGSSALLWAVRNGDEAIVRLLLARNADINAKGRFGWTAIHWAVLARCEAIVQLLLDYKVDIDVEDEDGLTALSWAARHGYEAIERLLLEYKEANNHHDGGSVASGRWIISWLSYLITRIMGTSS